MPRHLGFFFFYVRIISRLLWNGPWSFLPQMSTLHTRSFWHSTYIKCNCNSIFLFLFFLVFLSFPTCGFISIFLDCWCFVYELLCNKFTLPVQIIIYWKNTEWNLKDAFFHFVKYVKNLCCSVQRWINTGNLCFVIYSYFSHRKTRIAQFEIWR